MIAQNKKQRQNTSVNLGSNLGSHAFDEMESNKGWTDRDVGDS